MLISTLRYGGNTGDKNCVLSSAEVSQLVNSNSLQVEDDWDLYARTDQGDSCRGAHGGKRLYLVALMSIFGHL